MVLEVTHSLGLLMLLLLLKIKGYPEKQPTMPKKNPQKDTNHMK
jgi:hypothetical protein